MTDSDKKQFAGLIGALGEIFGQEVSKPKLALYFAALRDLSIEQVQAATETLAGSAKFFPRPVEIREAVEGSIQDRAAVAWRTFLDLCVHSAYPSLQVTDGALAYAIEEMGGYREAVAKIHNASPEMERACQKSFEQFYKIGQVRNAQPKYILGEFEARNRGLQSWVAIRNGQPVEAFEIDTPVVLVGTDRFVELKMPLDLRTGQLASAAREALAAGGEAIRRYLPAPAPKLIAGQPIPDEEPRATPEEVAQIQDAIAALSGRRVMRGRLLSAAPEPTETDTVQ